MEQQPKIIADQLNRSLDDLGAPHSVRERANILSKILHIPRQQAWNILEGHIFPENDLLQKMSAELDIDITLFKK